MDLSILRYLAPIKGMSDGGGILSRVAGNMVMDDARDKEAARGGALAEALRRLGGAKTDQDRFGAMADYANQGYDPNDLRDFNTVQKPDYSYAKSVGDSLIDLRTGKPIYTAPQKPEKPDYSYLREVGGSLVDVRTGKPVFTAEPKPKDHNVPTGYGMDVRNYLDMRRGVKRDKDGNLIGGGSNPLDPAVEDAIARRASDLYRQSGNPEDAQQQAYDEVVGSRPLVESGDTGVENDGSGLLWDKHFQYMTPQGFQSSVTRSGGGRSFRDGQTATNPKTGEKMVYRNGGWTKQ